MPQSTGRSGAGACTTHEQRAQLSLGRRWRITKKLAGMYSNTSGNILAQPAQRAGAASGCGFPIGRIGCAAAAWSPSNWSSSCSMWR